jgi:hypothetical protein
MPEKMINKLVYLKFFGGDSENFFKGRRIFYGADCNPPEADRLLGAGRQAGRQVSLT